MGGINLTKPVPQPLLVRLLVPTPSLVVATISMMSLPARPTSATTQLQDMLFLRPESSVSRSPSTQTAENCLLVTSSAVFAQTHTSLEELNAIWPPECSL